MHYYVKWTIFFLSPGIFSKSIIILLDVELLCCSIKNTYRIVNSLNDTEKELISKLLLNYRKTFIQSPEQPMVYKAYKSFQRNGRVATISRFIGHKKFNGRLNTSSRCITVNPAESIHTQARELLQWPDFRAPYDWHTALYHKCLYSIGKVLAYFIVQPNPCTTANGCRNNIVYVLIIWPTVSGRKSLKS